MTQIFAKDIQAGTTLLPITGRPDEWITRPYTVEQVFVGDDLRVRVFYNHSNGGGHASAVLNHHDRVMVAR